MTQMLCMLRAEYMKRIEFSITLDKIWLPPVFKGMRQGDGRFQCGRIRRELTEPWLQPCGNSALKGKSTQTGRPLRWTKTGRYFCLTHILNSTVFIFHKQSINPNATLSLVGLHWTFSWKVNLGVDFLFKDWRLLHSARWLQFIYFAFNTDSTEKAMASKREKKYLLKMNSWTDSNICERFFQNQRQNSSLRKIYRKWWKLKFFRQTIIVCFSEESRGHTSQHCY